MSGYVRIHRSLIGHAAFRNDAEAMAFAWMVVRAAWRPVRLRYKHRAVGLARGQLAVSVRDFASAMDRDKAWIERLLKRLKSETMIETRHETGFNVITICNYDEYQPEKQSTETPKETQGETDARQTQDTEQRREEREEVNKSSEDKSSGTVVPHPAADFCKAVFDSGVSLLARSDMTEKAARSLIGRWRKSLGDAEILTLIRQSEADGHSDPGAWITAAVATRSHKHANGAEKYVSESGFVYRSANPEDVMREAEKRADWTTYYQAKSDRENRGHG